MENFDQIMTKNSCQERINILSKRILNRYFQIIYSKKIKFIFFRIYQLKSPIQSSNWDQLDNDEKLEQLIDINDTLFERIVNKKIFSFFFILLIINRHLLLMKLMEFKNHLYQQLW